MSIPEVRSVARDIETHGVKRVSAHRRLKVARNRQVREVQAQTALDRQLWCMRKCQKRPTYMAKEAYRGMRIYIEVCVSVKRDLRIWQKRHRHQRVPEVRSVARDSKRALLSVKKRPILV